jgi:ferredoxin
MSTWWSRRWRVEVDFTKCTGRGLCAELLPERITLDDWGYPIVAGEPMRGEVARHARRAVSACPTLALTLRRVHGD